MKIPRIIKDYFLYKYAMSSPELDNSVDRLINIELSKLITNDIGHTTCMFLRLNTNKELTPYASGVMAKIDNVHYILTASHVIEDWSNTNKLFIEILGGHISVAGKACGTIIEKERKLDVGYIKLKDSIVPILKDRYTFLTSDKFFRNHKLLDEANYCAYGYPTEIQKKENEVLKPLASAYWVLPAKDKVFEYYGFDPLTHYVLEFRGKAINVKTGKIEKIKVAHYGLSGGGLWYTDITFHRGRMKSEAQLIGILTEFRRDKYDCLVANRIEVLIASIHNNEKNYNDL